MFRLLKSISSICANIHKLNIKHPPHGRLASCQVVVKYISSKINSDDVPTSPEIAVSKRKVKRRISSSDDDSSPRKCSSPVKVPKLDLKTPVKKAVSPKLKTTGTAKASSSKSTVTSVSEKKEAKPSLSSTKSPLSQPKTSKTTEKEQSLTSLSPTKSNGKDSDSASPSTVSKTPAKANVMFLVNKTSKEKETEDKSLTYNPTKSKYHPIDDAFWKRGDSVPYSALAKTFQFIEEISGRLRMIEILSNFFRSVIVLSPDDLLPCIYLSLNQLAPAYEGLELGVAETSLMKAIAQCTGRTLAQIKADAQACGDLGIVAEQSRSNQRIMVRPPPHTVRGVFAKLKEIANMSGASAMSKKVDKIQTLFVACRNSEARFIIRSLAGKLRIGLAEQSLLQAVAQACGATPPNQKDYPPKVLHWPAKMNEAAIKARSDEIALTLKTTYCQCPNYDRIVPVLLSEGVDALLERCQMMPGTPLKPMLAHPTKGVHEVLQRFEGITFTCEWKYDGERAQIHIANDGTVSIYSRNQENNTNKYPDIIGRIKTVKKQSVQSCILDCEAVAWDSVKKQIQPFQVLSTRKRKDANEADIKVQVCVFMFDLLYLNGEPLVTRSFAERRALLQEHFSEIEGHWQFATSLDTTDMDELQNFLDESVKGNCEGLMVKTLQKDATYEIAKRSRNWLKLKKDYLSGVGDSLDLVVLGGYRGRGKRTGVYGGFLLGCYDPESEEYQSICKLGTGFSDDDLQKHSEFFKDHIIPSPKSYYRYESGLEPDVWFDTVQVWEVKCADLSLSPVHRAAVGIIDSEKGISLRFPRFIRIREDKTIEDSTSAQQVADMYSNQDQIKNQQGTATRNIEEDFY